MGFRCSDISSSHCFMGTTVVILFFLSSIVAAGHPHPASYPRHSRELFRSLSGCELGEHRAGLGDLKGYLHHLGYLPDTPVGSNSFNDDFDAELESALIAYQNFFNLNVTGRLDDSTIDLITTPRCGVPDVVVNINNTGTAGTASPGRRRSLYSYFNGKPRWPNHLTYALVPTAGNPSNTQAVYAVLARAFAQWSKVTWLDFTAVSSRNYWIDLKISFEDGDGPVGKYLAYALAPTAGVMHIDETENWRAPGIPLVNPAAHWYDLETTVLHEIGHLLGLDHSNVSQAVMYPYIPANRIKTTLHYDDQLGIWGLYGRR